MNKLRSTVMIAFMLVLAFGVVMSWGPAPAVSQALQHDSSLPIEISADSLEVLQEEQIATFAGNVDAVQGDLVLSADKLLVHYEGESSDSVGLAAGQGNSIRQIDAVGHVIITSPKETAEGDHGTYDVPGKFMTLEGDVVLTRGANVIRGERLELDLVSGKSRMVGADTPVAEGDGGQKPENGRVRALFTPKSEDGANNEPLIPKAQPQ